MPTQRYRTFWPRFWAGFIDGLIFLPIVYLLDKVVASESSDWINFSSDVLYGIVSFAYSIVLHWRYGKTIGKMVTHVTVLRNDTETSINLRQSFLRDSPWIALTIVGWAIAAIAIGTGISSGLTVVLGKLFQWCSFAWFLVEIVTMLTNDKRRAVHDYIADTVVVRDS